MKPYRRSIDHSVKSGVDLTFGGTGCLYSRLESGNQRYVRRQSGRIGESVTTAVGRPHE